MANILDLLDKIATSIYGRDVRQGIIDAIRQCYEDGKAGVNDLQARTLIEAVMAVNEQQAAEIETLTARVEELESGESGGSSETSTTSVPTFLVESGTVTFENVGANKTATQAVSFTETFTSAPTVLAIKVFRQGANTFYSQVTAQPIQNSITTTGFTLAVGNKYTQAVSPSVLWVAFQPTTVEVETEITTVDGMTEADVRALLAPITAALDSLKIGYDGTEYDTPGASLRQQINALHVLIGDEPGTAIPASAIGYGEDSNVADEIDNINGRLTAQQSATIVKDNNFDIGDLVSGSTINASNGSNVSAAYGTRTGYVDFSVPVLLQFDFDLSFYQYDVFTHAQHNVSSIVDNPTNGVWADGERITVLVPSGSAPCFRIGIMRKDRQEMTTDATDPTSDFYKIKQGISIYRYTDTTLSKAGIPADALAVKQAIGKSFMLDVSYRQNIPSGSDLNDYLTTGNYWSTAAANVSNSPTTNNFIMFVFSTINSGRVIQIVQESSLASKTFIRYYNGTVWTAWKQFLSSADIDIDVDAMEATTSAESVVPVRESGTLVNNGLTIVSDGNGTYKVSGTATANTAYNLFYNETRIPANLKRGIPYSVKVSIPSLYAELRVGYIKESSLTNLLTTRYNGSFTIPDDAEGLYIRLFFRENSLDAAEFAVHPDIYPSDSIGDVKNRKTPTWYPPMLTIIDDDGYGYFYRDLMPLCVAKNAPIASAVVTGFMGTHTGYMTWEQVQECYAAGCEILSHGYNHKTDTDILEDGNTAEEIEQWYRMAKYDLQLHGIKSDIFVFNNNTANVIQCQQAAHRVYKGAIHAAGYAINGPDADPYYIKRFNFTAGSQGEPHTLQEMTDNIDALVAAGTGWDVWMIHTSSTGGWSADEVTKLGAAIDYARAHGVLVTTVEHAMRTYYGIG